jgi:hypothetical protein
MLIVTCLGCSTAAVESARNRHKLLARTSSALAGTRAGMLRIFRATPRPDQIARKFLVYSNHAAAFGIAAYITSLTASIFHVSFWVGLFPAICFTILISLR